MSSYVNWCDVICFNEPTMYRAEDKRPLRANKVKPEKLNLIRLKSQNIMACMLLYS